MVREAASETEGCACGRGKTHSGVLCFGPVEQQLARLGGAPWWHAVVLHRALPAGPCRVPHSSHPSPSASRLTELTLCVSPPSLSRVLCVVSAAGAAFTWAPAWVSPQGEGITLPAPAITLVKVTLTL